MELRAPWPGPRPPRAPRRPPGWERRSPPIGRRSPKTGTLAPRAARARLAQERPSGRGLHIAVGELSEHYRERHPHHQQRPALQGHVELGAGDHENRPVPEVDAVGALPDPAQRLASEQARAKLRVRVGARHDHQCARERHQGQAAAVEQRLELAESEAQEHEPAQSGEPCEVEQPRRYPAPATPQPPQFRIPGSRAPSGRSLLRTRPCPGIHTKARAAPTRSPVALVSVP